MGILFSGLLNMDASTDTYHTPALLYLICAMSAMSFVVCAYRWLWRAHIGRVDTLGKGFEASIGYGQLLSFVFVMILSIFIGFYDFYVYARPVQIYGEVLVLCAFLALSYALSKSDRMHSVLIAVREMLWLGFLCVIGWAATVGFGFSLMHVLKVISVIERGAFDVLVIFLSGLVWNAPILWMYYKVLYNSKAQSVLQGRGFHKFLWPVLFAYVVILIPLMMQDISNSEQWHEMHNAKPMRRV